MVDDDSEPEDSSPREDDGRGQSDGHEGRSDPPTDETPSSPSGKTTEPERGPLAHLDADELSRDPRLLAQFTAYLQENHLHIPLLTPDPDQMQRMREDTPELYEAYVQAINRRTEADFIAETAPYTAPQKAVSEGRRAGMVIVLAVLALAAWVAYLGNAWAAAIITGIDVVALAAIFVAGSQDSHSSDEEVGRD